MNLLYIPNKKNKKNLKFKILKPKTHDHFHNLRNTCWRGCGSWWECASVKESFMQV